MIGTRITAFMIAQPGMKFACHAAMQRVTLAKNPLFKARSKRLSGR